MKLPKFTLFSLLLMVVFSSCERGDLFTTEQKTDIKNVASEIENRSSIDDCMALLERFIPDTKEEIEFLNDLEMGKTLSKTELETLNIMHGFENPGDLEVFLKEYHALDCVARNEAKLPFNDKCGDELYDCVDAILSEYISLLIAGIYFWDAESILADLQQDILACSTAYVQCKSGN